jgi:hypothetical protein
MHFSEVAQRAFSFLERAGFSRVESGSAQLRYESEQTIVIIQWDGELEGYIGLRPRKGEPEVLFSLTDLLNMLGVDAPRQRAPFQVSDENRLPLFVDKVAQDMQTHGQPALAGDRMFFRKLGVFRTAQADALMRDTELRRVRSAADKAWRERDLHKLIGLYMSIEAELSEAEKGKLDYARKHV